MQCVLLLSLATVLAACPITDRAIVNEVFYDAFGDDRGSEFVELFNPTTHSVDLSGVRLEAGDGAGANRWALRWTAPAGLTLVPAARYLIGGARVTPPADAVVELSLQNGPDAVRLVWPDATTEVVGYGALAEPEYYCGQPAIDAASGQSLARIPDGAMSGVNALDFRARSPSPGRANQFGRHVEWLMGGLTLTPSQPEPAQAVQVAGVLVNAGADSIRGGTLSLRLLLERATGDETRAGLTLPRGLAPGESLRVAIDALAPETGVHVWKLLLDLPGDESPIGTRDSLRARTGPGALELTEIQFHPTHAEGEWIELRNRSGQSVALNGWTLEDRSGTRGTVLASAALAPDSFVVLAQHRDALLEVFSRLDTARVVILAPWPSLNNGDGADGIAETIELAGPDGLPADHAAYSATLVPAGVPLERGGDGHWRATIDPLGTPAAPPLAPRAISGNFALFTPRLRSGTASTRIAWALPWREARLRIDAYDLAGDRVGTLLGETSVAARGERDIATSALGGGCYVLAFEARPQAGSGSVTATRLLRIEGEGR